MERTVFVRKSAARIALENYVVAHNNVLREAVKHMSTTILLRNAHPAYRADFARENGINSAEFIYPTKR
jgi:hypothetical protein